MRVRHFSGPLLLAVIALVLSGFKSILPSAQASPPKPTHTANEPSPKAADIAQRRKVRAAFLGLPMSFERNEGQTDAHVKFLARGHGYSLFLTPTEAVMVLTKPSAAANPLGIRTPLKQASNRQPNKRAPSKARGVVLRMQMVGSNPGAALQGQQEMPGKANYFTGQNPAQWHTHLSM